MVLNWYDPYKDDDAYYSGDEDKHDFYLALENAGIVRRKFRKTEKPEIVTGKRGGKYVKSKSGKLRSIINTTNSVPTGKTNIYGRPIYISKKNKPFVFNRWGILPITKFKTEYTKEPVYKIIDNLGNQTRGSKTILLGPRGGKILAYVDQSNGNYVKKANFIKIKTLRNIKPTNTKLDLTNRHGRNVYKNKRGVMFVINPFTKTRKSITLYQTIQNKPTGKFTKKGQPITKTRDGSLYYLTNSGKKTYIYTPNMFKEVGKTPTGKQLYTSWLGNVFYIGKTGKKHRIYQNSHLNKKTQFKNASGRPIYIHGGNNGKIIEERGNKFFVTKTNIIPFRGKIPGRSYVLTKNGKISYKWRFPKQNTNKLPLNVINKIIKLTE